MIRRTLLLAAFALAAAATVPAPPASAAADPAQVISRLGNEGLAALAPDVGPAQRLARFRQLFSANFDLESISRFVLGRYWRLASANEREEFPSVFREYITLIYSERLSQFGGEHLQVTGTRNGPDGLIVASQLVRSGGKPVEIDWRMTPYGDTYKISDVIVDAVSMAATQRSEFASVIQRNGGQVGGLIATMRAKIAENEGAAGASAGSSNPPPQR